MKKIIASLVLLAACNSQKTYVLLNIDAPPAGTTSFNVIVTADETNRPAITLTNKDGSAISAKTSAALEVDFPYKNSTVSICVDAFDTNKMRIQSGSTMVVLQNQHTVPSPDISFSNANPACATASGSKSTLTVTTSNQNLTSGFTVTSDVGAIACPGKCTADFDPTAKVTLTATPTVKSGVYFQEWTGDCADRGRSPTCTLTMDKMHSVGATFVSMNVVFVTSGAFSDLSKGAAMADQFCQAAANAQPQIIPTNTYRAWISANGTAAKDHFGAGRGWMRPDGNPVLDSMTDSTKILYPATIDETNTVQSDAIVATGTDGGGNLVINQNCLDFSSNASGQSIITGKTSGGSGAWTHLSVAPCNTMTLHLYCFGINSSNMLTIPKGPGRTAFVSRASWAPMMGAGSADTICSGEATTNSLAGTYSALLATEASTPVARPPLSTAADTLPWIRPDGIPLVAKASDLTAGMGFLAAFDQASNGIYFDETTMVWTGSDGVNAAAMAGGIQNCNDWSSVSAGDSAMVGVAWDSAGNDFFQDMSVPCNTAGVHVYCLQQ